MRTTGVSGRLVRLAAVMIPMFGLLVLAQAPRAAGRRQAAPPAAQPGQPPPGPAAAAERCRRRRNAGADFSPKPPVKARTPQEQAKAFILPPGYRMELVVAEPDVISPAVDPVRRQRPHVRRRVHHLHARRRRQQPAHAREPHHALREHQGRRRLRQAHGLRRQARAAAHHRAARRQQHPDQRDRVRRRRQVHRHQQRRRRRQARALLLGHRHRPRRQPRARAGGLQLGPRQLDLHDLQRLPHPLDAERHPQGADRAERRAVGRDDGRRREDVVHGRGRRARPDELPGADPLRRVHRSRAVRARVRDRLAGVGPVRHAGRHDPRAHAGRPAEPLHRGVGRRRRARAPRARRSARRSARDRARRPADSPRADRQERRR